MVEKVKEAWFRWIPGWLPIVLALLWIATQWQRNNDRLDTLERQMRDVQQYLRTDHKKSSLDDGDSEYNPNHRAPQESSIPPLEP